MVLSMKTRQRRRTIWISDSHLGTRECNAHYLLDFLRCNDSETLNLLGDIFDRWALARSWHWRQEHNDVFQKLLRKAHNGTPVIYLPGNHDEFARDYIGLHFGYVEVATEHVRTTTDGLFRHARWHSTVGARGYQTALILNRRINNTRRRPGLSYWSLLPYLRHKTKRAVQCITDFELAMVRTAALHQADGIVCGLVDPAEIRMTGGRLDASCDNWVENCTALVEHFDGSLDLVQWAAPEDRAISTRHGGDGRTGQVPLITRPALRPEQVQ